MSYKESSRLSTEGDSINLMSSTADSRQNSLTTSESSLTRDSIVTYTTDFEDSSVVSTSVLSSALPGAPVISAVDARRSLREPYQKKRSLLAQQQAPQGGYSEPFYRRKRFWAICGAITVILSAIFIPLLFLVIIPNVAQSSVNKSQINFDSINITNPTNDDFQVTMSGRASETGPFSARITFNGPLKILYNNSVLGSVEMDPINVSGGKGTLTGSQQRFTIENKDLFNSFASQVLVLKEFEWTLQGSASVSTLGINVNNLSLYKTIKIPGSGGFITNLVDLQVTENSDKTLSLLAVTNIYNPSPIGIELGDLDLQLKCDQTILSNATAQNVFLGARDNNITITGNAVVPTSDQDKANLLKVINGFLTGTPVNTTTNVISITPKGGPVSWLSYAAKGLSLSALVGNQTSKSLIDSLDFGEVIMKFTPDDPYSPTISSKNAVANYRLPFHINVKILSAGQQITMSTTDNKEIATFTAPQVPVNDTGSQLTLDLPETKMKVLNNETFSNFLTALTTNKNSDVVISGKTDIVTVTDILGQVPVQGIPFNITSKLQGFDQFNSDGNPPKIIDLDILSGTPSQIVMGVVVNLVNPSQYSISVGKVSFDLVYQDSKIGTAVIPDLSVVSGSNQVAILTTLDDPANTIAKEVLVSFLTGTNATISIRGNDGSTNIASLIPAFKAINIPSTLPPLQQSLISNAKLVVDDRTVQTNYSTGSADMSNPFTTPISIYTMNSSFSYNGAVLGTVNQDIRSNPIFIPGNSIKTLQFPVKMLIDPAFSFSMLRTLALQNNLDVTVLDSLIALSNVNVPGADLNAKPTPQAISSFNLVTFVTTAMAKIPVTVNIDSEVAIGNYFTRMTYKQDIITTTDQSILKLIPMLAAPLVSRFTAQSQMTFDSIYIQNIDVASFDTLVSGSISNTGPLPATISFPNGADVFSSNVHIGRVSLPPIITDPTASVTKFNNVSKFFIDDVGTFTSFSMYSFSSDSVTWEISTDSAVVTSFGLPIGPIPIKKTIQVGGFGGLKQFALNHLNLSPFQVFIDLTNPSSVGIELGKVVYDLTSSGQHVTYITGDNISVAPNAVSTLTFSGELQLTSQLIGLFVSPNPPPIVALGVSVTPPKATGDVPWLDATFKSLQLTVPFNASLLVPKNPPAPAAPDAAPKRK